MGYIILTILFFLILYWLEKEGKEEIEIEQRRQQYLNMWIHETFGTISVKNPKKGKKSDDRTP